MLFGTRTEKLAREFHEEFESLASLYGYEEREEPLPWSLVSTDDKMLMCHAFDNLQRRGTIY
jgi:hypothetical protein